MKGSGLMRAVPGILGIVLCASAPGQQRYPFRDYTLPIEQRIDNLLSLLTLEEKIAGLGTRGVVAPRLGIQGIRIGEAISGIALGGPMQALANAASAVPADRQIPPTATTQFPQPVGLAYTWNPELIRKAGAVIGKEARYIWETGKSARAYVVLLAPNVDLARDPRWGRSQETFGEDAFLAGSLAASFVKGLQSQHGTHWQTAAVLKHFLANSNEDGRYSSDSVFDVRLMREYYSVPFQIALLKAAPDRTWPLTTHGMVYL
jgi:beta-glucosidase